jgi:Protein of unknown function (DUF1592)/Protein of unknown function (DUF1588)/Protein of unknown function (DUF1587)/Protein of unknown function (DUF1585)/Protein of unknown function (DUF1595)/Planctomycete cytochrome C
MKRLLIFLFAVSSASALIPGFLETHCVKCHDADEKNGNVDLTSLLPFNASNPDTLAKWVKIHDVIDSGEMPPPKKPRPPQVDRTAVTRELASALVSAERARRLGEPRTTVRRLTRAEYENTMRDLFDLPGLAVRELLPADGSAHGFDNNADALDISHVNMAAYMEAAEAALDVAIAQQPKAPEVKKQRMSLAMSAAGHVSVSGDCVLLKDKRPDPRMPPATSFGHVDVQAHINMIFHDAGTVGVFRQGDDFQNYLSQFVASYPAKYRVRTSLWSFTWDKGEILPSRGTEVARLMTVHFTGNGSGEGHPSDLIAYFDAPSIAEQVHEVTTWFNCSDTICFTAESLLRPIANRGTPGGIKNYPVPVPGIACDYVEVEGPLYESWPPPGHVRLFGDLPLVEFKADEHPGVRPPPRQPIRPIGGHHALNKPETVKGVWTVKSERPLEDADRLLADFLPRAFRRPVADAVRQEYVAQVAARLEAGDCFESAMRWAYQLSLCSPDFLHHMVPSVALGRALNDDALANRLAYFLWNGPPDGRLRELAAGKRLHPPEVLKAEVERMLGSEKSQRFVENFLGQWLKLRTIGMNDVDKVLYPEFQKYLQDSMVEETRAYFREMIDRNLDAAHLVKSDFAMLNERLATHYGIEGVEGTKIRRVALPAESPRGPFLTQGALLKITANGTVTSPVLRGSFVMERLLGRPPEPPPANVPAVEPDVRGATTIREQLALHRDNQSCAGCHAKFDPAGFALESFDVIGGERTRYRATREGAGEFAPRSAAFTKLGIGGGFKIGREVDPSGELADGRSFREVREFQSLIAQATNMLLTNMAKQFLVYSTGREVSFGDRDAVERIVTRTAANGGGMRTLIHEIVCSELFQTP